MQLVQRLTGISRPEKDNDEINMVSSLQYLSPKKEPMSNIAMGVGDHENDQKNIVIARNEENDTSSSVITDDNNYGNNIGENQANSCFITSEAPILEPQFNPYMTNYIVPNSTEFMCSSQQLSDYSGSMFSYDIKPSFPDSSTLGGMKDFGAIDYSWSFLLFR